MSFNVRYGDLFSVEEGYIMHGCNAMGVMGSGVARIIRDRYPEAYERYVAQHPYYILGEVIPVQVGPTPTVINAITQEMFGMGKVHADYDAIRQSLKGAQYIIGSGLFDGPKELHMPFIGAGLAGGNPLQIVSIMREELRDADIPATLWIHDRPMLAEVYDDVKDILVEDEKG